VIVLYGLLLGVVVQDSSNNGSLAILRDMVVELGEHGIEVSVSTLQAYRKTSHSFSLITRVIRVSHGTPS